MYHLSHKPAWDATSVSDKNKAMVEKAIEKLKEGAALLAHHQKFIRKANQHKCHWKTMAAYKGNGLTEDKEGAKQLEKAERIAEQQACKRCWKTAAYRITARNNPINAPVAASVQTTEDSSV